MATSLRAAYALNLSPSRAVTGVLNYLHANGDLSIGQAGATAPDLAPGAAAALGVLKQHPIAHVDISAAERASEIMLGVAQGKTADLPAHDGPLVDIHDRDH